MEQDAVVVCLYVECLSVTERRLLWPRVWLNHAYTGRIQYSRGFLLNLRDQQQPHTRLDLIAEDHSIAEIFSQHENFNKTAWREKRHKVRKRGRRGGVRQRLKRLTLRRIPLPSMLLCNAQSIRNKMDKIQASVTHLETFRDACVMAFTETWLTPEDLDTDLTLTGLGAPVRLDRGGVCLYVNQRWCKHITVRETVCTTDIELCLCPCGPITSPVNFPNYFSRLYTYILKPTQKML